MSINDYRKSMWVNVLSDVLNTLCMQNRPQASKTHVSKFCALRTPKITIEDYVNRIVFNSYCSEECFVLALIYIERLIRRNQGFFVDKYNVHRLILTSVMIAEKYLDDESFDNAYYSRVGGLSLKKMNELEREFLFMINFNLHVENELFTAWNSCFIGHHRWLVTISQQYEFTSFDWEDEVVSLMTSMLRNSDVLTPIKDFPQIVYGNPAKFEEPPIPPRLKPGYLNCGYPIWQYPNPSGSPPTYLPRIFQTNVCV